MILIIQYYNDKTMVVIIPNTMIVIIQIQVIPVIFIFIAYDAYIRVIVLGAGRPSPSPRLLAR